MIRDVFIGPVGPSTEDEPRELAQGVRELRAEFPSLRFHLGAPPPHVQTRISVDAWCTREADPRHFDVALFHSADSVRALGLLGPLERRTLAACMEILTRYQALVRRKNEASMAPAFARVLARHHELHDLAKPLVAADYWHALDVWQWVLRLEPEASLALQIAALFHDIERLTSEAEVRIEHHATDYEAYKDSHARRGAELLSCLEDLGLPERALVRARELVGSHERPTTDGELAILNDADALSFFALNSPGFLDYYGHDHAAKKIAYTLRRLRPETLPRLRSIRHRADVGALLSRELCALADPSQLSAGGAS